MSLADPQSITINGVTTSLPRVSVGSGNSEYRSGDGTISLKASNTYGRRTRRVLRVDHQKVTADPFIPANNSLVSASVYLVVDQPIAGYTAAELKFIIDGFRTQIAASSDAAILKLLGGES